MLISLIVAMDLNNGIGFKGQIPWKLSSDLRRFKTITLGHHIIMGRKTHSSIGHALPGRANLVISRNSKFTAPGCVVASSLQSALEIAKRTGETEVFIIGGAEIYKQAMPLANRIYLTLVQATFKADVYFPRIDPSEWNTISTTHNQINQKDQFSYTFSVLDRIYRVK